MFIRPLQFIAIASKRAAPAVLKTALAILPFNFVYGSFTNDVYQILSNI